MDKLTLTQNKLEEYRMKTTKTVDSWKDFLLTSSNNHKYDFSTQLLIYATKPEATACANFDFWSKDMKRKINGGSKGIPVLTEGRGGKAKLVHLFDITSTTPTEKSPPIKLWEMKPHLEQPVLEALTQKHGDFSSHYIESALLEHCETQCREYCEDKLDELMYYREGSMLEDLDELNVEMAFKRAVTASVQFSVLTRCGFDPEEHLDHLDFVPLFEFDTQEVVALMGDTVADISKSILVDVGKLVLQKEKEILEKPLAKDFEIEYNIVGQKYNETEIPKNFNKSKEEQGDGREENTIRGTGRNLHTGRGRNVVPRPDDGGLDRSTRESRPPRPSDRLRTGQTDIPPEPQNRNTSGHADERQPVGTPLPYRGTGSEHGETSDFPNDGEPRTDRGNSTDRPKMGGQAEHDSTTGEGNRTGGTGVQLEEQETGEQLDFFASIEDTIEKLKQTGAEELISSAPVSSLSREKRQINPNVAPMLEPLPVPVYQHIYHDERDPQTSLYPSFQQIQREVDDRKKASQEKAVEPTEEATLSVPPEPVPTVEEESKRTAMYSEISRIGSDRIARGDFSDYEMPIFTNKEGKEFALGFFSLGNGTTVSNFLEGENNNYKQVGHIAEDGTVKVYDESLPENALEYLKERAEKEKAPQQQVVVPEESKLPETKEKPTFDQKKEEKIAFYVEKFGIDEDILRDLLTKNLKKGTENEFGRFDRLIATVDKQRAKMTFDEVSGEDTPLFRVNVRVNFLLKAFVTGEEPPIDLTPPKEPSQAEETVDFPFAVGDSVTIDDTQFLIKNISEHDVTLVDPSLSYPIMRSEPKDYFLEIVDDIPEKVAESEKIEPSSTIELEKSMEVNYQGKEYVIDSISQEGETVYLKEKGNSVSGAVMLDKEEVLPNLVKQENGEIKKFPYAVGDVVTLEGKEVGILAIENAEVVLQDRETFSPMVKRLSEEEFLEKVDQAPESPLYQVKVESSPMEFGLNEPETPLSERIPVGLEVHIDDSILIVESIDEKSGYVIFNDEEMVKIGMESVLKTQIEIPRVLEHLEMLEKEEMEQIQEVNAVDSPSLPQEDNSDFPYKLGDSVSLGEDLNYKILSTDENAVSLKKMGVLAGDVPLVLTKEKFQELIEKSEHIPSNDITTAKEDNFPFVISDSFALEDNKNHFITRITEDIVTLRAMNHTLPYYRDITKDDLLQLVEQQQKLAEKSTSESLYEAFQYTSVDGWQENRQKQNIMEGAFYDILGDGEQATDLFTLVKATEPQSQEAFDRIYQVIAENKGKELPTPQISSDFAVDDVVTLREIPYKVRKIVGDEIQLNNSISRPPLTFTTKELVGRLQSEQGTRARLERNLQDLDKMSTTSPQETEKKQSTTAEAPSDSTAPYIDENPYKVTDIVNLENGVYYHIEEITESLVTVADLDTVDSPKRTIPIYEFEELLEKYNPDHNPENMIDPVIWKKIDLEGMKNEQAPPVAPAEIVTEPQTGKSEELYNAFQQSAESGWENYPEKSKKVENAIFEVLQNKEQVEDLLDLIVDNSPKTKEAFIDLFDKFIDTLPPVAEPTTQDFPYEVKDEVKFPNGAIYRIISLTENDITIQDKGILSSGRTSMSKERFLDLVAQVQAKEQAKEQSQEEIQVPVQEEVPPITADTFLPDFEAATALEIQEALAEMTVTQDVPEDKEEKSTATNYKIQDEQLGNGKPKDKFQRNVLAIQTLQQIESENRLATPEEQEILANYVGWGGLQEAFDDRKTAWATEYAILKELLPEKDYAQAKSTVLDSHYTSPTIIQAMYDGLEKMGLPSDVKLLEPAMGVGNFLGAKTDYFAQAKCSGTELDSISGRIAQQLYPEAKIEIRGFQSTKHRDNGFDVAIGNVPFGDTRLHHKKEQRSFFIHDFFFAKALDKVKTGGVVAFITSKGTLDKESPQVREYLSQRADLLGAIRLPNTAFKKNAGTDVTADIIFLQKRDKPPEITPEWVNLGKSENGISMNQYFVDHPEMIMGEMEMVSGRFKHVSTCSPDTTSSLKEQLATAIEKLSKPDPELLKIKVAEEKKTIPVPDTPEGARDFSFVVVEKEVYFNRQNTLEPPKIKPKDKERMIGMVELVDQLRKVIDMQVTDCSELDLEVEREKLLSLHDNFYDKFGVFADKDNKSLFSEDTSYPLLRSLQTLDKDGELVGKADILSFRTVQNTIKVTSVDTPPEALAVSISEKACVDIPFMAKLMGGEDKQQEIIDGLHGVIFKNPLSDLSDPFSGYLPADEYLSGNVREKLAVAKICAENHPELAINVKMLERVQPKELETSEISVRLGATWIPPEIYKQFMFELFQTSPYAQGHIDVKFSPLTAKWEVTGKSADKSSTMAHSVYGSKARSGYKILENALNLKDTKVYDTVLKDGKPVQVYNAKQSQIVESCQKQIMEKFEDWIWENPERREMLTERYNSLYNSIRPREFDGSHLSFEGMTDKIVLNPHQKNAVARTLYGENSLLAHCVGAGKTFTMIASAMEGKRLGLHSKSMIIVPNHLTSQVGADVYKLYPSAKVLVAGSTDFTKEKRQEICSRIATGNYDIVVLGHSQFKKIPLTAERVEKTVNKQIDEITSAIQEAKRSSGDSFTVKNLEAKRKELEGSIKKLINEEAKDSVVFFEDLGIDKLYVDEAHKYKNLFLATKMTSVSGISSDYSQQSTDMLTKCQYLDEKTGGKGVVFATGTPISNTMSELFVMMKYLQSSLLEKMNLQHFDSWVSNFCMKVTDQQLNGTGQYKEKTRFAKFFNLPELISMWKQSADVQTEDMLKLPSPSFKYVVIENDPTPEQEWYITELCERAEDCEQKLVDNKIDNMGIITMDGRKIALDQRLEDERLPDNAGSKVNKCVENVAQVWEDTAEQKSTQLIFLDQGVPHFDGTFNLYDDIRDKLVEKGIPKEQVAFIHEAKDDEAKEKLFSKVRNGDVRVLIGSTEKMGAGTNCQNLLIALHHLDIPWRPSEIDRVRRTDEKFYKQQYT